MPFLRVISSILRYAAILIEFLSIPRALIAEDCCAIHSKGSKTPSTPSFSNFIGYSLLGVLLEYGSENQPKGVFLL